MPAQFAHDRLVVPGTRSDKMLHRLALPLRQVGDRLRGLPLQLAKLALQDNLGQFVLFHAVEAWQIPAQKYLQADLTTADLSSINLGLSQQRLRHGMFEQGHPCPPSN